MDNFLTFIFSSRQLANQSRLISLLRRSIHIHKFFDRLHSNNSRLAQFEMQQSTSPHVREFCRAAQYVRMSTDHQQYSTHNQTDAIKRYAESHSMQIVRTYSDEGKSGLNIAGRDALRELINDVQNGRADFAAVLVYDVSRWGRFQDSDESAYYEYVCKRAGVRIHYCAEQFENDGSLPSTLLKTIKRTM